MKAGMSKSIFHEFGYIALVTITLILLSLIVFPLFIALLPMAVLIGCVAIWHYDAISNNKKGSN